MDLVPAAPPPPGQVSNFIDPPSRAPQAIVVLSFLMALCFVVVCLRMYAKIRVAKLIGWDDVMAVLALITASICTGYNIAALKDGGLGPHMWDVPITAFTPAYALRIEVIQVGFPIVGFFVKASVLLLLLRLFPKSTNRYTYILCYLGIAMVFVFNVICVVLIGFYCISRPSDHGQLHPSCTEKGLKIAFATAGFNVGIDLYILAIPVPIVLRLNMSLRKKIAVLSVFTSGLLACLCSILTLYYRVAFRNSTDSSWTEIPAFIVGNAEFYISIITACLPCLPALSTHFREKGFSLRGLLSHVSSTRTSRGSRRTHRSEGLVELHDVDAESGKDMNKGSVSLSDETQGADWVYNKQGGTPTARDLYEIQHQV